MEAHGLANHLEGEAAQRMNDLVRLAGSLSYIQGRKTIILVSGGLIASTRPGGRPDVRSMMQTVGDDIANAQANLYVPASRHGVCRHLLGGGAAVPQACRSF
jgi:hypothetical protein